MATRRTLILSGIEIPRIGLGTNRLTYSAEHVAFVAEAVAAGVGHIDTAHRYTRGESEKTIGAALSHFARKCVVATKGGSRPGEGRPEVLRKQIEESLLRLRADSIDLYYLHRIDPETPVEDSIAAISAYRDSGEIQHLGLSEVEIDEIERAREIAPITAVQNQYNLSERKHDEVVDYCAREGIVFVPFSPLGGTDGALVGEIAERHGATRPQVALAWLLRRSPTVLPIPGTLSVAHVRENLDALEVQLSDAEFEALRGESR